MAEMVRLNTRVSVQANDWLDKRSYDSGIPKSTLVMLAIESYMQQHDVMKRMADMGDLIAAIERMEKTVKSQELQAD